MEKKQYIAPYIEVIEIAPSSMLAQSTYTPTVKDEVTEEDAWMSNKRRGNWGDLWNSDK